MNFQSLKEIYRVLEVRYLDALKTLEAKGVQVWDKRQELAQMHINAEALIKASETPNTPKVVYAKMSEEEMQAAASGEVSSTVSSAKHMHIEADDDLAPKGEGKDLEENDDKGTARNRRKKPW